LRCLHASLGGSLKWKRSVCPVLVMSEANLFVKLTENIPSMGLLFLVSVLNNRN